MKVVQRQDVEEISREQTPRNSRSMLPPSLPLRSQQVQELEYTQGQPAFSPPPAEGGQFSPPAEEPLFLPASQLSVADQERLESTGLGIERMTAAELAAMMDDEDEDLDFEMPPTQREGMMNDYQLFDDTEMVPTQNESRVR